MTTTDTPRHARVRGTRTTAVRLLATMVENGGSATTDEWAAALDVSASTARTTLADLVRQGKVGPARTAGRAAAWRAL